MNSSSPHCPCNLVMMTVTLMMKLLMIMMMMTNMSQTLSELAPTSGSGEYETFISDMTDFTEVIYFRF